MYFIFSAFTEKKCLFKAISTVTVYSERLADIIDPNCDVIFHSISPLNCFRKSSLKLCKHRKAKHKHQNGYCARYQKCHHIGKLLEIHLRQSARINSLESEEVIGFFSLSLGFGTIMTYASYVDKKENALFQSTATAVSDLTFALIAGIAIMPAVFAFGIDPQSGPGLVFETLPYVFGQMPAGGFVAILFFLALLVAALTSSISMLEVAVAFLVEEKGMSRIAACLLLVIGGVLLAAYALVTLYTLRG